MLSFSCLHYNYAQIPGQVGLVLQSPLAKQDTVADPDRTYPLLQL